MREVFVEEWSKGEIELLANTLEDEITSRIGLACVPEQRIYKEIVRTMLNTVNRGNVLGLLEFKGSLWCSTNSGVFVYNQITQQFERVGGV